ncbi:MAG: exopolysaccharide biosynthesis protein [Verrucomicrobiota bacterium]
MSSLESPHHSLSQVLRDLVELPVEKLSLRIMTENVGDKGFGLLLAVLSLPSALPIPATGYSTPFGILFVLLGAQLIAGRPSPWLPERALKLQVSKKLVAKVFTVGAKLLSIAEKFVRPRMRWITSLGGHRLLGFVVVFMASLMILPIPMTNTFPATIIFFIGISLSEDDGLAAIIAFIGGILSAFFYCYVIYLLFTVGIDGVIELKDWIKDTLLGRS